jgi:hypothetical protein
MAGVVWMSEVSGGSNFLINLGSSGVSEANYITHQYFYYKTSPPPFFLPV